MRRGGAALKIVAVMLLLIIIGIFFVVIIMQTGEVEEPVGDRGGEAGDGGRDLPTGGQEPSPQPPDIEGIPINTSSIRDVLVTRDGRLIITYFDYDRQDTVIQRWYLNVVEIDLDGFRVLDKYVLDSGDGNETPRFGSIVSIYGDNFVAIATAKEGFITPFPFFPALPVIVETGGKIIYDVATPGEGFYKSGEIDFPGYLIGILEDKFVFAWVNSEEGTIKAGVYSVDAGMIITEGTLPIYTYIPGFRGRGSSFLAYSYIDESVAKAVFILPFIEQGGALSINIGLLEIDFETLSIFFNAWPSTTIYDGGYVYAATGYLEGDDLYLYIAIQRPGVTEPRITDYIVEKWNLGIMAKDWSYLGFFYVDAKNYSVPLTSIVWNDVFYVSHSFLAAYKDGEELWRVNGWGKRYDALRFFLPVEVVEGGKKFFVMDGSLYILHTKVADNVLERVIVYKVSRDQPPTEAPITIETNRERHIIIYNNEIYVLRPTGEGYILQRL